MQSHDADPMDLPTPPTADSITAEFGVALFTFASQPTVEEAGAGYQGHSADGGPVHLENAGVGFTVWRNPDDHDDPVNLADIDAETRAMLDAPPVRPLPAWIEEARQRLRYPLLAEAVRTTPAVQHDGDPFAPTVERALVEHAEHILINSFRAERTDGRMPTVLRDAPTPADLAPAEVEIDGARVDGLRLDRDAHVVAVGAQVGDRILTAVIPRAELAYVRLAFVTRPTPSSPGRVSRPGVA
ncbi:hypothetical protein [Clavibacter sp. VKM Ac-2872]|uniref:hypothetical protein n=1 Tax=Clavibacter sp. VKM Ac-2872 TaxID=2783812 RepID=UPI00188CCCA2|nr:hypothetical protein [Clavibacter sp. VKM Ac-2872]MBF4623236.1 hypothetical protein [Clavibacter sp. VKM Ac-2872]